MNTIVKTAIVAASAALIANVGAAGWAQQQPGAAPAPQATPAQPGPGMGQQMMQQGMEHGKAGQSMGRQMEEKGNQQGGEHKPMGPGTMPQPSQGTSPPPSK